MDTLDSLAALLDVDATYHAPGMNRLLDAVTAPPLTCAPCGGAVLTASGRHRCVRCGRDYGPVDRAAQDDAGDLLGATERGDRFETL